MNDARPSPFVISHMELERTLRLFKAQARLARMAAEQLTFEIRVADQTWVACGWCILVHLADGACLNEGEFEEQPGFSGVDFFSRYDASGTFLKADPYLTFAAAAEPDRFAAAIVEADRRTAEILAIQTSRRHDDGTREEVTRVDDEKRDQADAKNAADGAEQAGAEKPVDPGKKEPGDGD